MINPETKRIAVIGAGVAGIVAAYLLSREHDVTLYEKSDYIGGHTHTVSIPDGLGGKIPVDTGFIVLNDRTYPLFNRFLSLLHVRIEKTDMSFSYTDLGAGIQYASQSFRSIFAQRKNLFSPSFWRLLAGILRFNQVTREKLRDGALADVTLGDHLEREGFSAEVAKDNNPVTLTYDMTRLQKLATGDRVCVTLNPWKHVSHTLQIREMLYDHPMYSFEALQSQKELPSLNAKQNTYYCGSYFGHGFHEDAVRSAVEVGKLFGIEL